jgi:hypothetical protein
MKLGTSLKKLAEIDAERYRLRVEYTDGFCGEVDLGFIFATPKGKPLVLEILRGNLFARCFIESGALAWPNGFELCPDALRAWIIEQRKHRAA